MGILEDASSIVTTSWEQNTVIWIIISGIIGGIVTQVLKFLFEQSIPQWQRKKATRIAIQKYSYPLSYSGNTSLISIHKVLLNPEIVNNQNHRLSVMYDICCFFGWIEILLSETFIEGVETPERLRRLNKMARYQHNLQMMLQRITYYDEHRLFPKDIFSELIASLAIPRWALTAIGQLMIERKGEEPPSVINILTFTQKYEHSVEFKKWLMYIENLLLGLQESRINPQWNLLVSLYLYVLLFLLNTSKKDEFIPSQWIPPPIKSVFDTVLWLPYKFRKYIRMMRALINVYRTNRQNFQQIVELLIREKSTRRFEDEFGKDDENEADQFRVLNLQKVVVDNYENLKYHVPHFPKRYPTTLKYFFEKSTTESTKLSIASTSARYLDSHYLQNSMLNPLKHNLEHDGYLSTINKPYYNYLSALEEDIRTKPHPAEYWNKKGIVYSCLKEMKERGKTSEKLDRETAMSCYDNAIRIDPGYANAWNNKGLVFIEGYHYERASDYRNAVECFGRAIECGRLAGFSRDYLADIYNNLGVGYYGLNDYVKALECFETALELDDDFKLAQHNKSLTVQKIGKRRKIYKSDGSTTYE